MYRQDLTWQSTSRNKQTFMTFRSVTNLTTTQHHKQTFMTFRSVTNLTTTQHHAPRRQQLQHCIVDEQHLLYTARLSLSLTISKWIYCYRLRQQSTLHSTVWHGWWLVSLYLCTHTFDTCSWHNTSRSDWATHCRSTNKHFPLISTLKCEHNLNFYPSHNTTTA